MFSFCLVLIVLLQYCFPTLGQTFIRIDSANHFVHPCRPGLATESGRRNGPKGATGLVFEWGLQNGPTDTRMIFRSQTGPSNLQFDGSPLLAQNFPHVRMILAGALQAC